MKNYGVLIGKAVKYQRDNDDDPHSELLMKVNGESFRIAINVRSSRGPVAKRLIEFLILDDIKHPRDANPHCRRQRPDHRTHRMDDPERI